MQEVLGEPVGPGLCRLLGAIAAVDGVVAVVDFQQALGISQGQGSIHHRALTNVLIAQALGFDKLSQKLALQSV